MSHPSILEYARFHNLIIDADAQNLAGHLKGLSRLPINDAEETASFDTLHGQLQLPEDKLQFNSRAGDLLARCMKGPSMPSDRLLLSDSQRSKMLLKMETPMLRSDHSKNMRWFRKPMDLEKLLIPLAEDRSLQAPENDDIQDILEECRSAADLVGIDVTRERLETTVEVVKALSDYLRDSWSPTDENDLLRRELIRPQVSAKGSRDIDD